VILRRRRFQELVDRQLDLFEEEMELLDEAAAAEAVWSQSGADDSEERYGDYQLVVDAIGEALHDIRETYAAALEEDTAAQYRATFDRAARRRFGRAAAFLEDDV
jgi:hypothetical protein